MSAASRRPDPDLAAMMAQWAPVAHASDAMSDTLAASQPTTQAALWIAKARDILPPDQTILADILVRRMIQAASVEVGPVGGVGWYFRFADGSWILSKPNSDVTFPRWGARNA